MQIYITYIDDTDNKRQVQHNAGIKLIKKAVKDNFSLCISEENIARTKLGKPYLPEHPNIHFSISHCSGMAICCICDSICGIDAEKLLSVNDKVAKRVFTEAEIAELNLKNGIERQRYFTSLWTLKEAYGKAVGTGLAAMKNASFIFDGDSITSSDGKFHGSQLFIDDYIISVLSEKKKKSKVNFSQ